MKVIVYRRPDGGVSVVYPVINTVGETPGMTDDKAVKRAMKKLPADALGVRVIDVSDLPDRSYRSAWRDTGAAIIVDAAAKFFIDKARLEAAVQAHLDDKARARGYDGIMSAATYATSTDVTFAAEGVGYRNFRDSAWRYCYTQLASVQAGTRTAPTESELIAEIDANCPLVLP